MAQSGSAGSQLNAADVLVMARERQRIDVEAVHESLVGKLVQLREKHKDIKHKHAMVFYKTVGEAKARSQQVRVSCLACSHEFESTGPTRLVKHLLRCPLLPAAVRRPFQELNDQNESSKAQKRQHDVLVKEEAQQHAADHAAKQSKLVQQGIRSGMKALEVAEADMAIARFWYANGLSFSAASAEQDSFYREMVRKIQAAPAGYVPPGRNKLSGPLLDEMHDWMWRQIQDRDPQGTKAMRYCSAYVSDGWDSCDNLPLINSAFITANDGGIYWRSVDTSGKVKNAEYCAALMIADIYEFGPLKVIVVITDTCTTMKKCWGIVMDEFPWLMVLPCQAHVVSLLMKDIGKTKQVCSPPCPSLAPHP